jgi:diguanylate cyclase (GGDEF)-like protein
MRKPRGRIVLHKLFPGISPEFREEFRAYERLLARRIVIAGSIAVIVLLPVFQLMDAWVIRADDAVLLNHVLARTPVFLFAVAILVLWYLRPDGMWPRPVAMLFGLLLMTSITVRFAQALTSPEIEVAHASHPLLIIIAITAVLTTRGVRDLILIYGVPTAGFLIFLGITAPELGPEAALLAYPVITMIIAGYIAHVLFGMYTENFMAERQLRQHAMTDPLTHLLNRRAMDIELESCRSAAHRYGRSFAVVMADIDHFKRVNDVHGHDIGDQVLATVAARINDNVRKGDRCSRWGGEEFLILLHGAGPENAMAVAEKLRHAIAGTPIVTSAGPLDITMSFGVAPYHHGDRIDTLTVRADESLYRAKEEGRNRCVLAGGRE